VWKDGIVVFNLSLQTYDWNAVCRYGGLSGTTRRPISSAFPRLSNRKSRSFSTCRFWKSLSSGQQQHRWLMSERMRPEARKSCVQDIYMGGSSGGLRSNETGTTLTPQPLASKPPGPKRSLDARGLPTPSVGHAGLEGRRRIHSAASDEMALISEALLELDFTWIDKNIHRHVFYASASSIGCFPASDMSPTPSNISTQSPPTPMPRKILNNVVQSVIRSVSDYKKVSVSNAPSHQSPTSSDRPSMFGRLFSLENAASRFKWVAWF